MEKIWLKQYDPAVPRSIDYPEVPLNALLEQAAKKNSGLVALAYQGGTVTYDHLIELIDHFAAELSELGLEKGDRFALMLPTCPQFVIGYYAALKLGALVVPLNPALVAREAAYFIQDSGARMLLTREKNYLSLKNKNGGPIDPVTVITSNLESYSTRHQRYPGLFRSAKTTRQASGKDLPLGMEDLIASAKKQPPRVELTASDDAVIMYTGGSSGVPLGAVLTHGNLTANVLQCRFWNPDLGENGHETVLAAIPLSHSYGMTIGMNLGLATANRLILMPRFSTAAVLDMIEQNRVTYFPGVPSMFEAITRSPDLRKYNLRSIKSCLSGGAPLSLEVLQDFERITGGRLTEGYGLTEASPVTHANPHQGPRRVGSIGLPIPDTEMKVIDLHQDRELPQGAVGELCIRGPQVMRGYFNVPAETNRVLKDGWLHTGDIAHIDEDGFTYIVDRIKDLIISGGYNVYPGEVRAVLLSHPLIEAASVSSLRDPYKGEALRVVITPKQGSSLSSEEVFHFCRENLAAYKIPQQIEIKSNC